MKKVQKIVAALMCVVICLTLMPSDTKAREKVRIGYFPLNGFFQEDEKGNLSGYGVEYSEKVASEAGWDYDFVRADNWDEAMDMLRRGEIDILAPAEQNEERSKEFDFCAFPIGTEYGSLLALSTNTKLNYEDFKHFDGKRIGCVKTLIFMDSYRAYENEHNFHGEMVYYKDTAALVAALRAGEVDAIVANQMVKTETMKLLGRFGAAPFYYMVNKDKKELLQQLHEAVQRFSANNPQFQDQLANKYFSGFVEMPMSVLERQFVESAGTIRVGLKSNFAPFSYVNAETGKPTGIDVRIFDRIAKLSGLKFEYVMLPKTKIDYKFLVSHNINLVAEVENNQVNANLKGLKLSDTYLQANKVFVGKLGKVYDMKAKLRMAVASASASLNDVLAKEYPNYSVQCYENPEDALQAVQDGKADVVLQTGYNVSIYLSDPHYGDLTILPISGVAASYCVSTINGVMDTNKQNLLISIINKSLRRVTEEEKTEFISLEVVKTGYKFNWKDIVYRNRVGFITAGVLLGLLIFGLFTYLHLRRISRRKLEESEQKLRSITNNINGGVVVLRANEGLQITYANDGFLEILGCSREKFEQQYHQSYLAMVHDEDMPKLQSMVQGVNILNQKISVVLRIRRVDDTYVHTLFNGTLMERANGERQLYCVIVDMTEQNELMQKLYLEKKRSDMVLEKTDDVIFEVDIPSGEVSTSYNFGSKFGWELGEKIEVGDVKTFVKQWHMVEEDRDILEADINSMMDDNQDTRCRVRLLDSHGKQIWCQINQYPIFGEGGEVISILGNILNVQSEMEERIRLEHLAKTDALTGLYKKETFADLVMQELVHDTKSPCALLFLDLDHFKQVNDTLGHMIGDVAIQDAAKKLQVVFSNYDILSRFGGDEFCIFIKDIPHDTLIRKLDWLIEKMKGTYEEDGKCVNITCSIGVATTDVVGTQYIQLIEKADQALYRAKENGRGRYEFGQR